MGALKMLEMAIAAGPKCPRCNCDTFDDWWHDPRLKAHAFGILKGRIKCHGCGIYFSVTRYADGECHSTING